MKPISEAGLEQSSSPDPSPAAQAERNESARNILRLLARLPANQREVVRLKFQSGLSYKEISGITRLSVSNVGFLIHTAIRTLRQQLAAEEGKRGEL